MDHNTHNIGDLVKAFLKQYRLDERIEEVDINDNWEEIAGPVISRHTKSLRLKDGVLTLNLSSAALRHTLSFSKSDFIKKLNESLGKELIQDVILK